MMAVAFRLTDSGLALIVHVPVCALEWLIYRLGRKESATNLCERQSRHPIKISFIHLCSLRLPVLLLLWIRWIGLDTETQTDMM
jgi:hypothetical protein